MKTKHKVVLSFFLVVLNLFLSSAAGWSIWHSLLSSMGPRSGSGVLLGLAALALTLPALVISRKQKKVRFFPLLLTFNILITALLLGVAGIRAEILSHWEKLPKALLYDEVQTEPEVASKVPSNLGNQRSTTDTASNSQENSVDTTSSVGSKELSVFTFRRARSECVFSSELPFLTILYRFRNLKEDSRIEWQCFGPSDFLMEGEISAEEDKESKLQLTPPGGAWPRGRYTVELSLDGKLWGRVSFAIASTSDSESSKEFFTAVQRGDVAKVRLMATSNRELLEARIRDARLDEKVKPGTLNPLAEKRVEFKGDDGQSALHLAIIHDQTEVLQELLKLGAPTEIVDHDGFFPIHLAVELGKHDPLAVLLKSKASINVEDCKHQESALNIAAKKGDLRSARMLLKHGIEPNLVPFIGGRSAMETACLLNKMEMAKLIWEEGKDVELAALRFAHDPPILKFLLAEGADINQQRRSGTTALIAASYNRNDSELFNILLDAGADPNMVGEEGNTALHFALVYREADCVERLLRAGALADVKNNEGQTPEEYASFRISGAPSSNPPSGKAMVEKNLTLLRSWVSERSR